MRNTKIFACAMFALLAFSLVATSSFGIVDDSSSKISPYLLEQFDSLEDGAKLRVDVYVNEYSQGKFDRIADKIGEDKIKKTFYPEGFVLELSEDEVFLLAEKSYVEGIYPNILVRTALQDSVVITGAKDAWELEVDGVQMTGEGETVCVIDTGVDFTHPDLSDKNGLQGICNLDCTETNCPLDCDEGDVTGHGTHVAGIVAAEGGIDGIAKGAKVIGARVFDRENPTAEPSSLKNAVSWCVNNAERYGISVISMSLASANEFESYCDGAYTPLTIAINNSVNRNIAVVISTGNNGNPNGIAWPSCVRNAIPVGATDKNDDLWIDPPYGSNYNSMVKLFAPGVMINSTSKEEWRYGYGTGTSMATPMVSGSIALIQQYLREIGEPMSMHPKDDIENLLQGSGVTVKFLPDNWRRINVHDALMMLDKSAPEVSLVSPRDGFVVSTGESPVEVEFTCNAKDWQLDTLSVVVSENGEEIFREMKDVSGVFAEETFNVELPWGDYTWTCESEDVNRNKGSAEEYELFVSVPYGIGGRIEKKDAIWP